MDEETVSQILEKFLIDEYLAVPLVGYGQASAEQVTEALMNRFDITPKEA